MFGSQTLITGGHFQQHVHQYTAVCKSAFDRLLEVTAPAAFHNSNDLYDPPKCHRNTRVAILNKIMEWIRGLDSETRDALIMWLYGPAGSGKSAIARSIAECCYEEGILVASYFFSRSDSTRNHGRSLIATIAYQASIRFPEIRDHIIQTVDLDPFIFTRSLEAQLLALIIEPLRKRIETGYFDAVTAPRVVIIDGLDECNSRESQVKILSTISRTLQKHHLPLIFLVASRPEHDIMCAFNVGYLKEITSRLALNDDYHPSDDIRLFLQDKLTEIKDTHPFKGHIPPLWPSPEVLQSVVDKSSGQFIYASTTVKFIASSRHLPHLRLEIAIGLRPARHEMPFAELDALYRHILSSAENYESVLHILALCFHSFRPDSVCDIETILSLNTGDISRLLCDLASLISVEHRSDSEGRHWRELLVYHASLQDFLFDYSRAQGFYISEPSLCAELAYFCLHYLQVKCGTHFVVAPFFTSIKLWSPTTTLRPICSRNNGKNVFIHKSDCSGRRRQKETSFCASHGCGHFIPAG
ncbi:hypothetical protein GALMADRAFT_907774 [Galerina marginata CBS 339.88]|uniref:Nephrocystin 3-like N-terminal domain-containing protein n=1 Tax=Galerina marginata (strain CBS 339.88) TaxID=685588 RepID=A0A067SSK6_GALM3|nr:hypothetical protein GALMADRAFT_907774 [Galerina marginata CBS 339.88]